MNGPQLSVVIVNWNSRDELVACLDSLQANPPDIEWETVVVDNASSDGSADAARAAAPWARILANETNRGLAPAINQGLAEGSGDRFLICNADILFRPGSIDAMLRCLERHPRAAFVIPRLVHPDGRLQTSAGDLPTLRECLAGRQLGMREDGRRRGFWWHGWAHDEEVQVGHGAEACYLVPLEAVKSLGSLDERFFLDWEGLDWSARAKDAGWEIWFCPDAEIVHKGGVSVTQAGTLWVAASHRALYRYLRKHFGRRALVLIPLLAARAAVKATLLRLGAPLYRRAQAGPSRG